MKKQFNYILAFSISLMAITGCIQDDVVIDIDELTKLERPLNFEGPLIKATFYASDIFYRMSDSISDHLKIEEDGLICIKYKDSILTQWNDIVVIEEVNSSVTIPLNSLKSAYAEQTNEQRIKLNSIPIQRFDSMTIAKSVMSLNLQFPNNVTGPVTVEFPELSKNGQILSFNFDASSSNNTQEENLEAYDIIFKQGVDSSYIIMRIIADLEPSGNGNPPASSNIIVNMQMSELTPKVLFGYFGKSQIMDQEQTMNFGFFEDFKVIDQVEFYDIQLLIEFDNYFGVPYDGILAEAVVTRESTNESLILDLDNNEVFVDGCEYNDPIVPENESFLYDKDNSNIGEAVNMFPDKVDYRMQININPNGEENINFVTEDNRIAGNLFLIIPMWLRTSAYHRYDTIYNFELIKNLSDQQISTVEIAEMYFIINNWFPFELDGQVYLADDDYIIVDTLFNGDQRLLEVGIVDENDIVTEPAESKVTISLSREQLEFYKSKNVGKIIFESKTATVNQGADFVKLFDYYGVNFNMNMKLVSGEIDL